MGHLITIYGCVVPRNPDCRNGMGNSIVGCILSRETTHPEDTMGLLAVALELRSTEVDCQGMPGRYILRRWGTDTSGCNGKTLSDYPNPAYPYMTDRG